MQVLRIKNTRTIILAGEINTDTSMEVIIHLLTLASESDEDITLYINSPGGSVVDGLAIYDTMKSIKPDIITVAVGLAASMGSFLLSSGTKGKRYALPNAEILIHQPLAGISVQQETNFQIYANQLAKTRFNLETILAKNTGQDISKIHYDCERDTYMTSKEALEYGLIDRVINSSLEITQDFDK